MFLEKVSGKILFVYNLNIDEMKSTNLLVIGSKEYLKIIHPYLSDCFTSQKYIFCDEKKVIYNVGNGNSEKILKLCADNDIEHILFATTNNITHLVTNKLRNLRGMTYFIPNYAYIDINSSELFKETLMSFDISKPCLEYIEYHVNDHCNLNCKGCGHYSNIELEPNFADINQYVSDLKKLKELFWNVSRIRLMGGEPLLNPALGKFIDVTRELFPATDLRIVSNGLLIPKISGELVKHMREAHAGFDITNYPPTDKIRDTICNKLYLEKIDYNYNTSEKTEFFKKLTKTPINNEIKSFQHCESQNCNFLRNGTLSTCPMAALIYKYNYTFGTNYPTKYTNILSEITDGWKLYYELHKPIPLCKFCSPVHEIYNWEVCPRNKAKAEDWVVDEERVGELKLNKKSLRAEIGMFLKEHDRFGRYILYYYQKIRNIK
ncbi:MAG: radical SAM protein [Methanocorpusculum parvum]|nr:radical SAM protein [Methanocorpusculum parvum]